jgi:hypothetical protein
MNNFNTICHRVPRLSAPGNWAGHLDGQGILLAILGLPMGGIEVSVLACLWVCSLVTRCSGHLWTIGCQGTYFKTGSVTTQQGVNLLFLRGH